MRTNRARTGKQLNKRARRDGDYGLRKITLIPTNLNHILTRLNVTNIETSSNIRETMEATRSCNYEY
jgi:hypothetical protein